MFDIVIPFSLTYSSNSICNSVVFDRYRTIDKIVSTSGVGLSLVPQTLPSECTIFANDNIRCMLKNVPCLSAND